jgi:hypothetical protein
MTPMGAGRDISYVSNQMMDADTRAQKQLNAVKDGLHGKIEDHLDTVITTVAALEQTVIGAIGVSQAERREALRNVSEQIAKFERQQADDTISILLAIQTLEHQLTTETDELKYHLQVLDADFRNDFWKLFFRSLWRSIKGLF